MVRILLLTIIYTIFKCVYADIFVFIVPTEVEVVEFKSLKADFGPRISEEGLEGVLIYSTPANGCSAIQQPPNNHRKFWIVVVAKGNCTFEKKVRNAQSSGYVGVIVHNVNSDRLEFMSAKNRTGIEIPAVFVGEHTGKKLRDRFQYDVNSTMFNYYVILTDSLPLRFDLRSFLITFMIVGIFIVFPICFILIKIIRFRRREGRFRMPLSSVEKLPSKKFSKVDPYDTCVICMQEFIEDETIRILPCNHVYHMACVDKWLTENRRQCPTCRRKVYVEGETPISDTESDDNYIDEHYNERTPLISSVSSASSSRTFETNYDSSFEHLIRLYRNRFNQYPASSSNSNSEPTNSTVFDDKYLNDFNVIFQEPHENSNIPISNVRYDHNNENESSPSSSSD